MIALTHARVLTSSAASAEFTEPCTVLIDDRGTIESVSTAAPPPGCDEIDCSGKYVVPGLIDMHNHLKRADLGELPAWGVTTARDVGNPLEHIMTLRKEVRSGTLQGPEIFASGPVVDGTTVMWPEMTLSIATPGDADRAIAGLHEAGVDGIKLYMAASPDLIAAVVRAAHARSMPVTAHLGATSCLQAAEAGVDTLEHACQGLYDGVVADEHRLAWDLRWTLGQSAFWARYYRGWATVDPDGTRVRDCLTRLIDAGVSIDPTLMVEQTVIDWINDRDRMLAMLDGVPEEICGDWVKNADWFSKDWSAQDAVIAQQAMDVVAACVSRFAELGGQLVVGTDQPFCFLRPGESMHQELDALQRHGIGAADLLLGATERASAALGWQDRVGSIAAGHRADLLVVDADPLADITHLRRMHTILSAGKRVAPSSRLQTTT